MDETIWQGEIKRGKHIRLSLVSLGCSKNLVDSEIMLGLLERAGFELVTDPACAEVIIVNTCGFIRPAKEESLETIISMGKYKEKGECRSLIVTGCLAQGYGEELARELPEVNAFVGTGDFSDIARIVTATLAGERLQRIGPPRAVFSGQMPRILSGGGPSAYLKIAEGCNNRCSYCQIPYLRGKQQSRRREDIVEEARALVQLGVKELILIAQDTTRYGEDLYGKPCLAPLLQDLADIEGVHWLRLLYCYPTRFTPELIRIMRDEPKIVKYVDLPLQHINDRILERMNRRQTKAAVTNLLAQLRREVPGIALRTTFMVGFPGEGEEEYAELLGFLQEQRFDRAGFFTFSPEENTPAAFFPRQIPEEVKEERYKRAMTMQQNIATECNREWIGRELEVLIEGCGSEAGVMIGRSYRDAPDIDGFVYVKGPAELQGRFVRVRITGAAAYDLWGEIVHESGK